MQATDAGGPIPAGGNIDPPGEDFSSRDGISPAGRLPPAMNPMDILAAHCGKDSKTFRILVDHGQQVVHKALRAAERVRHPLPDLEFIASAGMLHDIGIVRTDSRSLGCLGRYPYIMHGVLGRALLEATGFPRHAMVCERHIGVGISADDVRRQHLPLPPRDMLPVSIEEQLICYADKFFSKNAASPSGAKSIDQILQSLLPYGSDKVQRFRQWVELFE
jgi:uncharacterized protein